jgi:CxxC motif-containing protein (DUF1111 family)
MRRIHSGLIILSVAISVIILGAATFQAPEAPIGLDNLSNGLTDQTAHNANLDQFAEVEGVTNGLGPLFNDTSCAACHLDAGATGAGSQVRELRVGYLDDGKFVAPNIRLASAVPPEVVPEVVHNRSLVNQRSICPEAHETAPENIQVRTERLTIPVLGDGFIEAVPDAAILAQRDFRCRLSFGRICGLAVAVPILEAPGQTGIGRFGWKGQHRSLLSFSADAYLNEMGITNELQPVEVATTCNPNTVPEPNNIGDIAVFTEFMRATKAPGPDVALLSRPEAQAGALVFHRMGCADCHVTTWQTAEEGTPINGGFFTVPAALAHKTFHPFTDFLLHDVGTGDGIVQNGGDASRLRMKTPALWGLRIRPAFLHDGRSVTLTDAILQHRREAGNAARRFRELRPHEEKQLLAFLRSL